MLPRAAARFGPFVRPRRKAGAIFRSGKVCAIAGFFAPAQKPGDVVGSGLDFGGGR
jgi:hypothetical protein